MIFFDVLHQISFGCEFVLTNVTNKLLKLLMNGLDVSCQVRTLGERLGAEVAREVPDLEVDL
jgi:hypothetical protein